MESNKLVAIGLLFLLGSTAGCTAQRSTTSAIPQQTQPTTIRQIALDQLGQLYTVDERNEVIQYRADGTEAFRYNNNMLGQLALIDPTNPFSLLLYYPDFQTIILLDRTLNEKNRILLSGLGLIDIELVALGNDNFIWLYDAVDIQLKKLDQDGQITFRTDRLNLLLQQIPDPDRLLALNNRLLMNDPGQGILIFDQFGRYETTLPVYAAENLQLLGEEQLLYTRGTTLYRYDLRAFQERAVDWKLPCADDCSIRIGKEQVYWLEDGRVQRRRLPVR